MAANLNAVRYARFALRMSDNLLVASANVGSILSHQAVCANCLLKTDAIETLISLALSGSSDKTRLSPPLRNQQAEALPASS